MSEDEKLNGFLDHELDKKEHSEVEALIAHEDGAKARLARMQINDDLVRSAHDAPMAEEVPDRFLKAIDSGIAQHGSAKLDNVVSIDAHRPVASNDNRKSWWQMGGAVAASLAVGLFFGTQLTSTGGDATMSIALNDALNTTPSAQTVALTTGERLTPQLTFARVGGGYCRQFSIATGAKSRAGVACTSAGQWSVEVLLPSSDSASAEDGYVTAGGMENPEMDGLVAKLRAGNPLDKSAEEALIATRWK